MTLCDKPATPSIKGEFASNGVENNLKHELGVISMARTSDPNSATGQFFICAANTPHLDGNYAAFGKAVDAESEKVVLDISKVDTGNIGYGFTDFPLTPVVIKSIRRG
jgi:peptidyl-prolyl cis-trans isomerase B (cyclophilin B)